VTHAQRARVDHAAQGLTAHLKRVRPAPLPRAGSALASDRAFSGASQWANIAKKRIIMKKCKKLVLLQKSA